MGINQEIQVLVKKKSNNQIIARFDLVRFLLEALYEVISAIYTVFSIRPLSIKNWVPANKTRHVVHSKRQTVKETELTSKHGLIPSPFRPKLPSDMEQRCITESFQAYYLKRPRKRPWTDTIGIPWMAF